MLKCCYDVSCELSLKFNCSKSYCFFVGKNVKSATADLYLGPDSIQWSSRGKYLGLSYHIGKKVAVNTDFIKHNFFTACNVVLGNSRGTDDIVRLNLIESYCLPLLTYGVNADWLKSSDYVDLNTCWNSVFRRIFHFHKHEFVRVFMCGLGRLDFIHLCHKMRLTFIKVWIVLTDEWNFSLDCLFWVTIS